MSERGRRGAMLPQRCAQGKRYTEALHAAQISLVRARDHMHTQGFWGF